MTGSRSVNQKPTREHVEALFSAADPQLVNDLGQAVARGCVAFDHKLPPGCLLGIVKSLLFTLDQRRKAADA